MGELWRPWNGAGRAAELCVMRQMLSSAGRSQYLRARNIRRLLGHGNTVLRLLSVNRGPLTRLLFQSLESAEVEGIWIVVELDEPSHSAQLTGNG